MIKLCCWVFSRFVRVGALWFVVAFCGLYWLALSGGLVVVYGGLLCRRIDWFLCFAL